MEAQIKFFNPLHPLAFSIVESPNRLEYILYFGRTIRLKEDGGRVHVRISPNAAGLDSLENRPFNLFPSEDERKTPTRACRLFTGDAL